MIALIALHLLCLLPMLPGILMMREDRKRYHMYRTAIHLSVHPDDAAPQRAAWHNYNVRLIHAVLLGCVASALAFLLLHLWIPML